MQSFAQILVHHAKLRQEDGSNTYNASTEAAVTSQGACVSYGARATHTSRREHSRVEPPESGELIEKQASGGYIALAEAGAH